MNWSSEAKSAIGEVPFFVRPRVRKRVEEEAQRLGAAEVTMAHVQALRKKFLTTMEEEVSGCQVETCFGPGGCPNRAVVCNGLAERLRELPAAEGMKSFLKKVVNGPLKIHHEFRISISDCPNACSRPQIADIGLIGACKPFVTEEMCSGCGACAAECAEDAITFPDDMPVVDESKCLSCGKCIAVCPTGTLEAGRRGYRIMAGGKLGRHPRLGREAGGIIAADKIPEIVENLLGYYTRHCREGERLGEVLEKRGFEEMQNLISP